MMDIRIGKAIVKRVEESLGPGAPPDVLFPEFDQGKFDPHKDWMIPNHLEAESGCLMISSASWYVETQSSKIIIDTCVGNCKDRPGYPPFANLETDYLANLKAAGIDREEIDYVLMTHLHIDHVGWNTTLEDGKWVPTFPNAKYVFSEIDLATWDPANGPLPNDANLGVFEDSIQPVIDAGLALTWKEKLKLDPEVTAYLTPGHSPGHCAINLTSEGQTALFSGDIMHSPIQVIFPEWNSLFCEDRVLAEETRRKILAECAQKGYLLMPAHWGKPHAAYVKKNAEGTGYLPLFYGEDMPMGGAVAQEKKSFLSKLVSPFQKGG